MTELALYVLAVWGLTAILVDGFPSRWCAKVPVMRGFFRCYLCVGFWSALVLSLLGSMAPARRLLYVLAGAGASYVAGVIVRAHIYTPPEQ